MKKICDLHTHSIYSDGTLTPTELVDAAIDAGLSAVALTDHNTVSGLDEFTLAAKNKNIFAVSGVEFSTDYRGRELHVLGLFVDKSSFDDITEFIGNFKQRKNESNIKLIERLNALGYGIDYVKLLEQTPDGYVNRAHIGADLVRRGKAENIGDAFDKLLSEKVGYYEPPRKNDVFETVGFIKSIGAVAVSAHPLLQLSRDELPAFLNEARKNGLDGVETQYSLYSAAQREYSSRVAADIGLCESGGSDFHGANKPLQKLATGLGDLHVPFDFYEQLLKRRQGV